MELMKHQFKMVTLSHANLYEQDNKTPRQVTLVAGTISFYMAGKDGSTHVYTIAGPLPVKETPEQITALLGQEGE
jgi:hypothetical protein